MPNVGAVLKKEITRLSRKELRHQLGGMKKTSAQHRRHIAALRRQVDGLERELTALRARVLERGSGPSAGSDATKTRFVAKGLRAHRTRLGLSAEDYGRLVGVSAQSIYSWERKASIPRAAQRASLAAIRGIGKREAHTRLKALTMRSGERVRGSRR